MMKRILIAAAALLAGTAAGAQGPGAPDSTPPPAAVGKDRNADGALERNEVAPGSNLDKRFDARDRNHDGKLSQDEYWMPPSSGKQGSYDKANAAGAGEPSRLGSGVALRPGGAPRHGDRPQDRHGSGVGAAQPSDDSDSSNSGGQ